ncbi:MAG: DUF1156 domain-containing protein [Firmicutes bacterium]|nr:DUF1156 domain-containing protein [Bacillota bacterium]
MERSKAIDLFGNEVGAQDVRREQRGRSHKELGDEDPIAPNLGKAIRLPVPDFGNPERKPTCLELDFPIAQINAVSQLEGNAGKPIYQMSKWWARRRSSVFRAMLIGAATQAPDDPGEAAKRIWDHYYCNHQKAGSFKNLRVLDCFMGGGTTLVEGSRLGMQMVGVDLNPIAWFVVKNEIACSDPEQVKAFFVEIEKHVKPQIQPFYITTCPRGHEGHWIDNESGETVEVDPIVLPPEARSRYRWQGPEVIYTFWAKHGPCQAHGCGHRTPVFRSPLIAEKGLSTDYLEITCPKCGMAFHAELGETRMAPGAERVVLDSEGLFTELSQPFATLLSEYDRGSSDDTYERTLKLRELLRDEPGLYCPSCGAFAGRRLADILDRHARPSAKSSERKKKAFGIRRKQVQMYLLIHPDWLKGSSGVENGRELGGWAGAMPDDTARWNLLRLADCRIVEVRGKTLPDTIRLADLSVISTTDGTVPRKAEFTCASCGRRANVLESVRASGHTAPVAVYALQCYCPECEAEGYNYGGRYFKVPDMQDITRLNASEFEWSFRKEDDLKDFWPKAELWVSYMTHKLNGGIPNWGYTHWWKMFNSRQLLVHTQLLKAIMGASGEAWPLDVREQALGAFQQYLRNQNMFCFWDTGYDKLVPMMSNANYHPKSLVVENCVFPGLGRGNWRSNVASTLDGVAWARNPWDVVLPDEVEKKRSLREAPGDPVIPGSSSVLCGSSTDLPALDSAPFDLVITDPPFGNNLFYADLADFFYVWLRIPLLKWYEGLPERRYFEPERTPHSLEVVDNSVEHPDDREEYEKSMLIPASHLQIIRDITGDGSLQQNDRNPLYRPEPSGDFYRQTLTACWAEAGRLLKDGGIMAFTFHHSEYEPWIEVLRALFDAGYVLVATYPVRSDESKGESGAFGSRKIEYDIIHVCRKRLEELQPVSWARMRRWVKDETGRLKGLLEQSHGKDLSQSDLKVVLTGKALEFYSRHYGKVFTGDGQALDVRDALLGINQLLDDLNEESSTLHQRPPANAEPPTRLYLRVFLGRCEMERDDLHKTLRGTGYSQSDLESRGWIRGVGKTVHVVPIADRFAWFTQPGRNRKAIKTDLDQAHFLMGAALHDSGVRIDDELNNPNFHLRKSVDDILKWYVTVDTDSRIREAAQTAYGIVQHWRNRKVPSISAQMRLDLLEEDE